MKDFFDDKPIPADENPIDTAIKNKSRRLTDQDKEMLIGIIEHMARRS